MYVSELKQYFLSISMFVDVGYYTKVEHGVFKILHGGVFIAKGSKISGLYILESSNVFVHSSSSNEYVPNKKKLVI